MLAPDSLNRGMVRLDQWPERKRFWLILLGTGALLFLGIGLHSPWPPDSPRFVEVAREMVESGQWMLPMRGGEYYPEKPPVFIWTLALLYWLTGNLKLTYLIPNALCSLLTVGLVYDLGRRLWNPRVAALAALLLLLPTQFVLHAKNAQIDGMLMAWVTIGCYGLLRHFLLGPAWGWYLAGFAFMGLGIITKGVGFLPVFLLVPVLWWRWRDRALPGGTLGWRLWLGPVAMLAVIACWLVPMLWYVQHLNTPEALAYRDNILFRQTGHRYTNPWMHVEPWYFFIANIIPIRWFPLPFLLVALWRPLARAWRVDPALRVLLVWVALVVAFFSISPGKRGLYVLPALPMFSLALASVLDRAISSGQGPSRWFGWLMTGVQAVLAVALVMIGSLALADFPALVKGARQFTDDPSLWHQAGALLLVTGLLWTALLWSFRRSDALARWFVGMMAAWILYSTWGFTILEPIKTPRNMLARAEALTPPNARPGLLSCDPELILFSRRDITCFNHHSSLEQQERNAWQWMEEGADRYLVIETGVSLECFDTTAATPLGKAQRTRFLLLGPDQRRASCPAPERRVEFVMSAPCANSGLCPPG